MENFQNPPAQELYRILDESRIIAVVGASSDPGRPSHGVVKRLQAADYKIIPINPNEQSVLGEKAWPSLSGIPPETPVDIVNVFRRPEATPSIAQEAVKIGAKTLWLQLGIENEEAARIARQGGLNVVMNACIAVELGRLAVPPKK